MTEKMPVLFIGHGSPMNVVLDNSYTKEAADFYVKVFRRRSKVKQVSTVKDTPSGTVEIVTLALAGQEFTARALPP